MTEAATDDQIMGYATVPDGNGGYRLEARRIPRPQPKAKKRKERHAPDPIKANPETSAQQLKQIIERKERLIEEKRGISEDIKDVDSEAKAIGFDVKAINAIIKIREMEPNTRLEAEAILETYKCSLGLE